MRRLTGLLDTLADWMTARSHVCGIFACWLFFMVTAIRAAHVPYWYDELLTMKITALPRFRDVWAALCAGLDLNPPFQYVAVRASQAMFGDGPMATRLPVTVAVLIMSICLFGYLRRRVAIPLAFGGMMMPWLSGAYGFAVDARPYGILLGCAGVVLFCWSAAAGGGRRRAPALAGLCAGLAIAFASHCYSLMLLVPVALGEAARLWRTRRPDWVLWAVVAVSAFPTAMYPVLTGANKTRALAASPFHVSFSTAPGAYAELLDQLLWPLLIGILLMVLTVDRRTSSAPPAQTGTKPLHEVWALVGFAAIPAVAVLLSAITTGSFNPRYGSPGIIGIACLAVWAVDRTSGQAARHGAILTALFAAVFIGNFTGQLRAELSRVKVHAAGLSAPQTPSIWMPGYPAIAASAAGDLPIVIASGMHFLEIDHFAEDSVVARTYYLTDVDAALKRTGAAWFDSTYPAMKRMLHLRANIEPAGEFLARRQAFLLYSSGYLVEWLPQELMAHGWRIRLLARDGVREVAKVEPPE